MEKEPIPREECPFCRTVIKPGATVCRICKAEKGSLAGCQLVLILGIGIYLSGDFALEYLSDGETKLALGAGTMTLLLIAILRLMTRRKWRRLNSTSRGESQSLGG